MPRLRRPSPALVISIVALFVAMGGTGYAAVHLSKDSVGSRQIKAGAVASSEVKNHSLKKTDFSGSAIDALSGKLGPTGPRGLTGPTGPRGLTGAPGGTVPNETYVQQNFSGGLFTLTLPPGSYLLGGAATADNATTTLQQLQCSWSFAVPVSDTTSDVHTPGQHDTILPSGGSGAVSAPGTITVSGSQNFNARLGCASGGLAVIGMASATRVGAIH
jgi:hypothetical protein